MSRQSRANKLKELREKKKKTNKKDYIVKSMWVGGRGTGVLKKHYSYDGGKTWSTSKDRPTSTKQHNPDKKQSNIPAKEGKQNNPDYGKKVHHQTPTPQKPSPTWGEKKDNKGGGKEAKSEDLKIKKKRYTMRERMADKNRKIFGKNQAGEDIVTKLQEKHKAWKKARKEGKLDEWRKKYKN